MSKNRDLVFNAWLANIFATENYSIKALTGDAGFRRYFRLTTHSTSVIAVDAPADKSNNLAFAAIADCLSKQGVLVPNVKHFDKEQGFFVLSDLGNTLLSDKLTLDNARLYYQKAIDTLLLFNHINQLQDYALPAYDENFVATELAIFNDWLLAEHLSIQLSHDEKNQLKECFSVLIDNAIEQPQCFMHRDYHSRNIMLSEQNDIAVIDFQDAVLGPITYDIVSLLRDCYVRWPQPLVDDLLSYFCDKVSEKFDLSYSQEQWQRWFDLMGVQRHIKASGIFARLYHRDGKNGYLNDIPLTLSYLVDICQTYPELNFIAQLIEQRVIPCLNQQAKAQAKPEPTLKPKSKSKI